MTIMRFISALWMPSLVIALICQILNIYLVKMLPEKFPGRFSAAKARASSIGDLRLIGSTTQSVLLKFIIAAPITVKTLKYLLVILAVISFGLAFLLRKA